MKGPLSVLVAVSLLSLPTVSGAERVRTLDPSLPRCHTSGLALSLSRMGAGLGNVEVNVFLRNTSKRRCFLSGYLIFGLKDEHHRLQPSQQRRGSTYFRADPGPHRVVLQPGGRAVTNLAWADNPLPGEPLRQCERPSAWLVVTPPGEHTRLLARLGTVVCGHGQLFSTALTSAGVGWRIGY